MLDVVEVARLRPRLFPFEFLLEAGVLEFVRKGAERARQPVFSAPFTDRLLPFLVAGGLLLQIFGDEYATVAFDLWREVVATPEVGAEIVRYVFVDENAGHGLRLSGHKGPEQF